MQICFTRRFHWIQFCWSKIALLEFRNAAVAKFLSTTLSWTPAAGFNESSAIKQSQLLFLKANSIFFLIFSSHLGSHLIWLLLWKRVCGLCILAICTSTTSMVLLLCAKFDFNSENVLVTSFIGVIDFYHLIYFTTVFDIFNVKVTVSLTATTMLPRAANFSGNWTFFCFSRQQSIVYQRR